MAQPAPVMGQKRIEAAHRKGERPQHLNEIPRRTLLRALRQEVTDDGHKSSAQEGYHHRARFHRYLPVLLYAVCAKT